MSTFFVKNYIHVFNVFLVFPCSLFFRTLKTEKPSKSFHFLFENSFFGPRWTEGIGNGPFMGGPRFHFFTISFLSCFSLFFLVFLVCPFFLPLVDCFGENLSNHISLLAFVSEFNKRCFLRGRSSMEMWCPDDIGRDSCVWVGPPTRGRACFNSPEWGASSSPVKLIQIGLFLF